MPAHEFSGHPLTEMLHKAFAALIEAGEIDLVANVDALEFDVQADDWTLRLEGWPVAMAFVALDDEPSSLPERQAALDAALDSQQMAALRQVNRSLGNGLAAALEDSGDGLSQLLALALGVVLESDNSIRLDDEDA